MPQDISATCNSCVTRFSIEHELSCPKGGLVLARHDDAAKEWGSLGARFLVPSTNIYKPKIHSRAVQGERTRAGVWQEEGTSEGGTYIVGEVQGGSGRTVDREAVFPMRPG